MIGVDAELDQIEVARKVIDSRNNISSFEAEGGPTAFGIQGRTADVCDGADSAVRIFLVRRWR